MASQGCFEMLLGVARGDGDGDTDRLLLSTMCCLCVLCVYVVHTSFQTTKIRECPLCLHVETALHSVGIASVIR